MQTLSNGRIGVLLCMVGLLVFCCWTSAGKLSAEPPPCVKCECKLSYAIEVNTEGGGAVVVTRGTKKDMGEGVYVAVLDATAPLKSSGNCGKGSLADAPAPNQVWGFDYLDVTRTCTENPRFGVFEVSPKDQGTYTGLSYTRKICKE